MRRLTAVSAAVALVCAAGAAASRAADGPTGGAGAPGSVVEAPKPVDPRDVRIGELVPDLDVTLADGKKSSLAKLAGPKGLVVVARSEGCPVGRKQAPSHAALEKVAKAAGLGVLYLNVAAKDTPDDAARAVKDYGFAAPYALDPERRVAAALLVRTTTECFVLDAARTLRYRGALDDQVGLGYTLAAPRHEYLRRAIDAVAAGALPLVEATTAPGCVVELAPAPPTAVPSKVTWHNRISRMVDRQCADCHRDGEAGPFPLVTRDDVLAQAEMVKFVVEKRAMPPWFAAKDCGPFATDRSLSDRDRDDLLGWLKAGGPAGDAKDAALPIARTKGWRIGKPDLVLEGKSYDVPASGVVQYQYQWIEGAKDEDRWVKAIEVRPSEPGVVHHVLVFTRKPAKDGRRGGTGQGFFDGGLSGYFAAMVPGADYFTYPDGMAKKWPAGTDLFVQVHYTPNGKPAKDHASIGMVFAKEAPKEEVRTRGIFDIGFRIPPGAEKHPVHSVWSFPQAGRILEFMPHMHVRGTAFRYELELPDGTRKTVLDIPRYDFNWQIVYRLREPLAVPKGARLHATGWFDNSAKNPANPDPTRTVGFGEQTFEEMMIGYFDWVPAADATADAK